MRVRRGLLFWGLLLIPLGGIPLLARAGGFDPARLINAWQLWPLIVIGIGLLILGSRTWLSVVGLVVMALTIGTIGGAAIANGTIWFGSIGDCGFGATANQTLEKSGSFETAADVRLDFNCGTINLRPSDGPGWSVHATYHGDAPTVDGTSDSLDLTSQHGNGSRVQNWTIGVPPSQLRTLQVTANAATMTADVGAAHLDQLRGDLNAGDARVQAGEASVKAVDLGMNAGRIRLTLGTGGTTGSLSVNAGSIDLCVPSSAGLRLTVDEQLTFVTNLSSRDLTRQGNLWTRPDGGGGTIELSVSGNAAAFNLDPDGGC